MSGRRETTSGRRETTSLRDEPEGTWEMMEVCGREGKAVQFLRLHLLMSRRNDGKCREAPEITSS